MSRTKRSKRWGQPGSARDGKAGFVGKPPPDEIAAAVIRPDRRERDREVDRIVAGAVDPDDVPVQPKPKSLWTFWRRW